MRTLADRLAEMRAERGSAVAPRPAPAATNRAETLARWFGARLQVAPDGAAVVVERRVALPPATVAILAGLPPACYFDTETTGLSTGAGTVVFLAGIGHLEGDHLVVRQLLLPDYPHEAALLRLAAGELAALPRVVTYNGRGFDLPLLTTRLTVHRLFREMAALPEHPRRPAAGGAAALPAAARRSAAGRRGVRGARGHPQLGLPRQRGAGPLLRLPARRLAGPADRRPRPQPAGHRVAGAARGGDRADARRRLARRAGARPARDGGRAAARRGERGGARGGRGGDAARCRPGPGALAATDGRAPAARRRPGRPGGGAVDRPPRAAPRPMPPRPGSRWRASASDIAATCAGRWRPRRRHRGCSTSPSRWAAAAGCSSSAGSACGSRLGCAGCVAGSRPPTVAPRGHSASPDRLAPSAVSSRTSATTSMAASRALPQWRWPAAASARSRMNAARMSPAPTLGTRLDRPAAPEGERGGLSSSHTVHARRSRTSAGRGPTERRSDASCSARFVTPPPADPRGWLPAGRTGSMPRRSGVEGRQRNRPHLAVPRERRSKPCRMAPRTGTGSRSASSLGGDLAGDRARPGRRAAPRRGRGRRGSTRPPRRSSAQPPAPAANRDG